MPGVIPSKQKYDEDEKDDEFLQVVKEHRGPVRLLLSRVIIIEPEVGS